MSGPSTSKAFGGWSISRQLFDWICTALPRGATILELGSGAGTGELAKRFRMYSVEHDARFLDRHASTYIHAPIVDGWYDPAILAKRLPPSYDLLLVDGPPQQIGRAGILKHLTLFDLTKLVVMDDVHRKPERQILETLAKQTGHTLTIVSNGTKSFGVMRPGKNTSRSDVAIAMTTAPRRQATLASALLSLREAGFYEDVQVFAEPGTLDSSDLAQIAGARTLLHQNSAKLGCFGNWKGSLEWLLSNTAAPWLMILQDDAIWRSDAAPILRAKLRDRQEARTGFISPYTSSMVVAKSFTDGWNECRAGWGFWGALALCMKRVAAEELLKHPRFAKHTGAQQVDAVVAESMIELNRPSFVHLPSLVDHIGKTSTIGRDGDPAFGRRGYRFKSTP